MTSGSQSIHVYKRDPAALVRPSGAGASITPVHGVRVLAIADPVIDIVRVPRSNVFVVHPLVGVTLQSASSLGRLGRHVIATAGELGQEGGNFRRQIRLARNRRRVGGGKGCSGEKDR